MKNSFLLFLLCIPSSLLIAQDYRPFQPSHSYFYQRQEPFAPVFRPDYQPDIWDLVVIIDSTTQFPGGSLSYNYEAPKICQRGTYGLRALGKGLLHDSSTGVWTILRVEGDSIFLRSNTRKGESWIFFQNDSLKIEARHDTTEFRNIWDQIDSVKVFSLHYSTPQGQSLPATGLTELVLSKNFGILTYFDPSEFPSAVPWNLKGLASPTNEWGDQWLDEWQIFQYEAGDEFHTQELRHGFDYPTYSLTDEWIKTEILAVSHNPDSLEITYILRESRALDSRYGFSPWEHETTYTYEVDTIEKKVSYHFPEKFPYRYLHDSSRYHYYIQDTSHYGAAKLRYWYPLGNTSRTDTCFEELIGYYGLTFAIEGVGEGFYSRLMRPLVLTAYEEYLPRYIKNRFGEFGDSTLFNRMRSLVLSSEAINQAQGLKLFPNPVRDKLFISGKAGNGGNLEIRILDIRGRLVMAVNENISPFEDFSFPVNLSGLTGGVYLYQVRLGNRINSGKLFKH